MGERGEEGGACLFACRRGINVSASIFLGEWEEPIYDVSLNGVL